MHVVLEPPSTKVTLPPASATPASVQHPPFSRATADAKLALSGIAVVVIGRNEGERLKRCLASLSGLAQTIVYVDSGSSDDSVLLAQSMGVNTIALDMSKPFTAARGRNEGYREALRLNANIDYIQFVDGDTEVASQWMAEAKHFLMQNTRVGAVFGRRRERNPEASVYNRLCDIEWNVPVGVVRYCGGDVMVRRVSFDEVNGYDQSLIAGEEPDLSVRLRHKHWAIHRIDAEMTLHDAAITQFGQWWTRTVRSGYAFAQGAFRYGAAPEYHWVRESWRAAIWGLVLPLATVFLAAVFTPKFLWLLGAYPAQVLRLVIIREGTWRSRLLRAAFYTLARFPEAVGLVKFHGMRLLGRSSTIIEYK